MYLRFYIIVFFKRSKRYLKGIKGRKTTKLKVKGCLNCRIAVSSAIIERFSNALLTMILLESRNV